MLSATLLSLVLAATPPVQAPASVPFVEDHGHVFFQASINGSRPVWIALDSGASRTVVDQAAAEQLRIRPGSSVEVHGAGGAVQASVAGRTTLTLGGKRLDLPEVTVMPIRFMSENAGREVAMILGYELFERWVVELDYVSDVMRLHEPKTFEGGNRAALPMELTHNHPYVQATITPYGRDPIRGRFVIDLGSSQSVIFRPAIVKQHDLLATTRTQRGKAGGVGGDFAIHIGRVASAELGGHTLRDVVALMPETGHVAAEDAVGNIGAGLLRRFRVYFDYSRKRILLEPTPLLPTPDAFDLLGVSLHSTDLRGIQIKRVRPDSPAETAALTPGDTILTINGKPVTVADLFAVRDLFRRSGSYVLGVARGGRVVEVRVET